MSDTATVETRAASEGPELVDGTRASQTETGPGTARAFSFGAGVGGFAAACSRASVELEKLRGLIDVRHAEFRRLVEVQLAEDQFDTAATKEAESLLSFARA
jgi:hypothetical protein